MLLVSLLGAGSAAFAQAPVDPTVENLVSGTSDSYIADRGHTIKRNLLVRRMEHDPMLVAQTPGTRTALTPVSARKLTDRLIQMAGLVHANRARAHRKGVLLYAERKTVRPLAAKVTRVARAEPRPRAAKHPALLHEFAAAQIRPLPRWDVAKAELPSNVTAVHSRTVSAKTTIPARAATARAHPPRTMAEYAKTPMLQLTPKASPRARAIDSA